MSLSHKRTTPQTIPSELEIANDLLAISRLVNSVQHLEHIDDEFGRLILSISGSDRVTISVPEPFENAATNLLVFGDEIPNLGAGAAHPPLDAEEPRWLQEDSAYHVDAAMREQHEIVRWSENVAAAAGLNSTMVAPIRWQGDNIAAITFRSRSLDNYDSAHLDIATEIANQVAGAIANQIALQKSITISRERDVLARISHIATGSNNLRDTFELLSESFAELVPWDRFAVTTFQSVKGREHHLFEAGVQFGPTNPNRWSTFAKEMIDLFETDPTPLIINQETLSNSSEILRGQALGESAGLKSWLLVPLIWRDEHIGHLHFRSLESEAYNNYHIDISTQISSQISGAIAGALANEDMAEKARERKVLADISRALSLGQTIVNDFEKFAKLVQSLIPFDRFSISRNSETADQYFPFLESGVPFEGIVGDEYSEIRNGITTRIENLDGPAVMDHLKDDEAQDIREFSRFAKNAGLHSWLVAPMFWRGDLVGSLHLRSKTENAFTERDLRLSGEIAAQLVGHIVSTDAYELLDREATIRNVLAELGRVLASTSDFASTLPAIEKLTASIVRFEGFSVGLINEQAETVRRLYANGMYAPYVDSEPEFSIQNLIATEFLKTKKIARQQFSSIDELKDFPKSVEAFEAGTRVFLTAPLISSDSIIGVLQLRSSSLAAFNKTEVDTTQRVADQIVGALAKSVADERLHLQAAALESADNAMLITRPSGTIEWVNSAFTRLSGWNPSEIIGQQTTTLKSASPTNWGQDQRINEALASGRSWAGVRIGRKRDGTEYPEETTVTPVLGQNGDVTHVIAIKRDISDRLIAEEAHENSLRIESENRELQRIAAARSEFLSTVSHELRTPLTTVSAFADILFNSKSENLTDRQRTHLGLIRKSSTQLSSLIDDLLDVSQADSGRVALDKKSFPIDDMVNEVSDTSRVLLATREQLLETTLETNSLSLAADRSRVIQIVTNLLTTASKFSKDGSTIKLIATVKDEQLQITVADQGSGISKADQAMMFSPFFRGDSQKFAQPDGRGLGLAVVRSLVDLHDGTITVDSKYRKGTSITVTLPDVTSTSVDS
ncbi:GAF domain-containing protein [Candidatus Lucifugimonas marina]|uniref:histidine kinase n=1 Tax=Candidatus Lucifugimonas marina TaxID=3038979 RepID=A0ABD4XT00_9CHLR|nr:GAF domain-containing protein [SAR202 cluster bacterium JH702]MDG0870478.1 GAF domain-containing protein [SAR202 cluster bacterium JH639]WFG35975.1 GAF domain-containing protein [SAR202 cluster bacterium JH545]